ncbi:tetratricopeptide repeat protein [Pseudomonas marincola]|uniref:tetratricopeptide repeat protein n=1 Tax=Pseudomonas marincola TaxID=437900 RepID=UPI0008EDD5B7|nr:tetratricopeptide repeat protein [Pseudomonas marincola]SFU16591.1 Flp pilus assembly protein TadD, contains TPR repeats [Pseudomonas marincola]
MNRTYIALAAVAFLSGCQALSSTSTDGTPPVEDVSVIAKKTEPEQYASFSRETLLALLTAELAGQRDRFDIALGNYVQQANATQDAGVAERGFRIAEYLGADQAALDTALIWAKNAPDDLDAQRSAAIQLARAGRHDEAMTYMEKVLQGHGNTHFDFLALSAAETDEQTRAGLLQSFDRLLAKYPDNTQLAFGKALLLQEDGQSEEALQLLEDSPNIDSEVIPLLLHVRLLQSLKRGDEAMPLLKQGIKLYPEDKRLRLTYARMLVEQGRIEDAQSEFSALVQQYPEDDDLRFSLALVYLEGEAWKEAIVYLEELVERGSHVDAAHYNLARAYEHLDEPESALTEYAQVGPGNEYLPAQAAQTELLFAEKRGTEATQLLAKARDEQPDYATQLYLIESEALSSNQQPEHAWQVIQQAVKDNPDDLNLLYARAMMAESRDDLGQLESDLRQILERDPENSMALNALGYTLADRTTRYSEARKLIEQAYRLNPEDPAILDSMGWINYRQNRLDEAEKYLRKALRKFPDHEVAAHLGEVLWAQGKQRDARKVWAEALENHPDSEPLRSTILRLTGAENL